MQKVYDFLVKNWKTTIVGVLTTVLTYFLSNGSITEHQFQLSIGLLVAIGAVLSKDGDGTITDQEKTEISEQTDQKIEEKLNEESFNKN